MHALLAVDWHVIWLRIFHPNHVFTQALWATIYMSIVAQALGVLLGLFAALARVSRLRPLRWLSGVYVWIFRGTPVLVQIFYIYFAFKWPTLHVGFTVSDAALAAIVALSINEGAYMREIIRAGIDSIDRGQMEAAKSLGMTYGLAMRRIVLPQALRVIVPPLGNEFNGMLKNTSLVSFIAVAELLESAQSRAASLFAPLEMFTIAAIWYLILTMIWTVIQAFIERRLNASNLDPSLRGTPWWQRTFGVGTRKPQTVGTDVVPELLGDRR